MKLHQLLYFQEVCRCDSVTKASKALHVSQSSISMAIKELESQFGLSLFIRFNQRLILTNEGKIFLKHANQILDNVEKAEQIMITLKNEEKNVRIGVPPRTSTFTLLPLYLSYIDKYPNSKISIIESNSKKNVLNVYDETFDIAIANTTDTQNKQLEYFPIAPINIVLCYSANHKFAKKSDILFTDLDEESIILFKKGSDYNVLLNELFLKENIKPSILMYSSQLHIISKMLLSGKTAAFMFDNVAKSLSDKILIKSFDIFPKKTSYLIWKKSMYINNKITYPYKDVNQFIDYAKSFDFSQHHN